MNQRRETSIRHRVVHARRRRRRQARRCSATAARKSPVGAVCVMMTSGTALPLVLVQRLVLDHRRDADAGARPARAATSASTPGRSVDQQPQVEAAAHRRRRPQLHAARRRPTTAAASGTSAAPGRRPGRSGRRRRRWPSASARPPGRSRACRRPRRRRRGWRCRRRAPGPAASRAAAAPARRAGPAGLPSQPRLGQQLDGVAQLAGEADVDGVAGRRCRGGRWPRRGTVTPKAIWARMASLWAASVPSTSSVGSASA